MSFTSLNFLVFLVCLFLGYFLVFRRFQWQFLLAASFVFYAFSGWSNLLYISVTVCSTWFASRRISGLRREQEQFLAANGELAKEAKRDYKQKTAARQRRWLGLCLVFNFAILAVVKYTDFVITNIYGLLGRQITPVNILLPMGISFYIFQTMSYLIDVYRGGPDEPNLFRLGLFTSFFPQLIQGPISRFADLKKTLYNRHYFDSLGFQTGLARVLLGFFKKLVISDRLFPAVQALSDPAGSYTGAYVIVNALFYALTLYADFTGGIDITIGVAQMLGIAVKENFDRPFYSASIADYWRRWHISMGTWFKDYLFYPISASGPMLRLFKRAKRSLGDGFGRRVTVYLTTIVVWFATGLWHGAAWHFIVWGLVNGAVIIISEELSPVYARFHKRFTFGRTPWYHGFQIFRTFWLMSFIRIFDVYANVPLTFRMYWSLVSNFGSVRFVSEGLTALGLTWADYTVTGLAALALVAAGIVHHNSKVEFGELQFGARGLLLAALAFAVLVFGVYGFGYDSQQFIYNKF